MSDFLDLLELFLKRDLHLTVSQPSTFSFLMLSLSSVSDELAMLLLEFVTDFSWLTNVSTELVHSFESDLLIFSFEMDFWVGLGGSNFAGSGL